MTTINDDHIRTFLADEARRAVTVAPSLDEAVDRLAPRIASRPSGASQRLIVLLAATLLLVAALGSAIAVGSGLVRLPPITDDAEIQPAPDLGIFEPVAGRIIYYTDASLWAVDPSAPSPGSTLVRLDPDGTADAEGRFATFTVPLGWSSDGTKLLFLRQDPNDDTFPYDRHLYILHEDGAETQLTSQPVHDAAISPDGSRVAFSSDGEGLYVIDAEGGQPVRIAEDGSSPTFSPDGTRIAYLADAELTEVWVASADGTDANQILADEPALAHGVFGLTWSPAGNHIAMDDSLEGQVAIYTFAPDGSNFRKLVTGGFNPHWSPDGSQIAYGLPGRDGVSLVAADGSNVRTFDFGASGPWHPGTLENRAEVKHEFFDGEVTFAAAPPWDYGVGGDTSTMTTLTFNNPDQQLDQRLTVVADPRPVETGCQQGPAAVDAEALARSVRSDPDLEATAPLAVSVGGTEALRMDVTIAPGASVCDSPGLPQVLTSNDHDWRGVGLGQEERMRLYLVDLPEGLSARILAIAISAPEPRFERVVEAGAPVVDSFEFHAP